MEITGSHIDTASTTSAGTTPPDATQDAGEGKRIARMARNGLAGALDPKDHRS